MTRILFIAHLDDLSGAQRALLDVIDALDRSQVAPEAICPADGPFAKALADRGVPTTIIQTPLTAISDLRGWLPRLALIRRRLAYVGAVRRCIRSACPDLVWVNSVVNVYAGLAAYLSRARLVWNIHEFFPPSRANRLRYFTAGHCADAIVAPARGTIGFFNRRARRKFHLLPNGVDTRRFAPDPDRRSAARERLGLDETHIAVATAGYLTPRKGIDLFLEAARQARDAEGRRRFFIIGPPDPNAEEYVRGLHAFVDAHELNDIVRLVGAAQNMEEWLNALDIFVLASRSENAPLVALEAMASGAAIVATSVGGVPELIEDGRDGLLVPRENPDSLAAAIEELAGDKALRRQLGETARARAVAEFSRERFQENARKLVDELIENRQSRH